MPASRGKPSGLLSLFEADAVHCVTHVSGLDPEVSGAPGGIRTPDPLLRRQTLFPTELRARGLQLVQFTVLVASFATGN